MTCQCEPLAKAGWALRGPAAHAALSFTSLEGVLAGASRGQGGDSVPDVEPFGWIPYANVGSSLPRGPQVVPTLTTSTLMTASEVCRGEPRDGNRISLPGPVVEAAAQSGSTEEKEFRQGVRAVGVPTFTGPTLSSQEHTGGGPANRLFCRCFLRPSRVLSHKSERVVNSPDDFNGQSG